MDPITKPAMDAAIKLATDNAIAGERTRMQGIIETNARAQGRTAAEVEAGYLQYISMRTKIEPSEIADMVLFLASEGARKVTGELISVSGNSEWEI